MSDLQNSNETLICPHCDTELDAPAIDYTVASRVGPPSEARDSCGYCDDAFTAENNGDGTVTVLAVD